MLCATAAGELLPPYVVYKAKKVWSTWIEGGPEGAKYDCAKSGWFDGVTFENFFFRILLPHVRRKDGKKAVICDNLSSHVSDKVVAACKKHGIKCIFLPPNSTQWTQLLGVALFAPMKRKWRKLLSNWKASPVKSPKNSPPMIPRCSPKGKTSPNAKLVTPTKKSTNPSVTPKEGETPKKKVCSQNGKANSSEEEKASDGKAVLTLPKDKFPRLLKALFEEISDNAENNLKSGFRTCGIVPVDVTPLFKKLSKTDHVDLDAVGNGFIDFVGRQREAIIESGLEKKRKATNVVAGKNFCSDSSEDESDSESTCSSSGDGDGNVSDENESVFTELVSDSDLTLDDGIEMMESSDLESASACTGTSSNTTEVLSASTDTGDKREICAC